MKENVHPLDFVFRLAEDHGIVLLNGSGFEAPDWSVRVSFANLNDHVYDDIGRAVRAVARGYRQAYEASKARRRRARWPRPRPSRAPRSNHESRKRGRPWPAAHQRRDRHETHISHPGRRDARRPRRFAFVAQGADLPNIKVLATGGTIAGAQASATEYGYKSGAYDVNSLLKAVPNLDKLAVITGDRWRTSAART